MAYIILSGKKDERLEESKGVREEEKRKLQKPLIDKKGLGKKEKRGRSLVDRRQGLFISSIKKLQEVRYGHYLIGTVNCTRKCFEYVLPHGSKQSQ